MESEFILNLKEISIQTILIALLNFGLTMLIKWPIKKVTAKKEENKRKAINTIIVFIPMLLSFVLSLMYYGIFENKWLDELVYETTANSYIFTVAIYAIYSRIVILIKGIGGTEQTSDNAVLSKEMIGYLKSNIKTISKTLKIDEKNLSRIVTEFDHLISIRNEITSNTLFQDISQTERLDNQLNQLEKQKNELTQSVANMQTQIANYQATLKKGDKNANNYN